MNTVTNQANKNIDDGHDRNDGNEHSVDNEHIPTDLTFHPSCLPTEWMETMETDRFFWKKIPELFQENPVPLTIFFVYSPVKPWYTKNRM